MGNNANLSSASEKGLKSTYDVDNYPARLEPARSHGQRFNRIGWRLFSLFLTLASLPCALLPLAFGYRAALHSETIGLSCCGYFFLVIFWNIFVLCWERARRQTIHPGAVVGMDLAIWLYSIVAWTFGIFAVLYFTVDPRYNNQFKPGSYLYITSYEKNSSLACFSVFLALTVICTIIHFSLFVVGCVQVDRHRKALKAVVAERAGSSATPMVPQVKECTCPCTCGAHQNAAARSSMPVTADNPRTSVASMGKQAAVGDDDVEYMDEKEMLKARNW